MSGASARSKGFAQECRAFAPRSDVEQGAR